MFTKSAGENKNNQLQFSRLYQGWYKFMEAYTRSSEMFKLFKPHRKESEQAGLPIHPSENNLKFWSHSFSTTNALALLCCGPCNLSMRNNESTEINKFCRI